MTNPDHAKVAAYLFEERQQLGNATIERHFDSLSQAYQITLLQKLVTSDPMVVHIEPWKKYCLRVSKEVQQWLDDGRRERGEG